MIGAAVSGHPEMMTHLDTTLGIEDLFDLVEIVIVDSRNRRIMQKRLDEER
jgi:hypothetical protein